MREDRRHLLWHVLAVTLCLTRTLLPWWMRWQQQQVVFALRCFTPATKWEGSCLFVSVKVCACVCMSTSCRVGLTCVTTATPYNNLFRLFLSNLKPSLKNMITEPYVSFESGSATNPTKRQTHLWRRGSVAPPTRMCRAIRNDEQG